MLGKRSVVGLLCVAILAGCATKPDGDLDDRNCVPDAPNGSVYSDDNALVALAVVLVIDLSWFAGCEAVVGITNGIHHFRLAHSQDGIYYSPDGAFSVGVAPVVSHEYQAQQQTDAGKDTVVFAPHTAGEPVYGVTVLTKLEDPQAHLSLVDFSKQASAGILATGVARTQIHAEDVQLGANPARLVIYRAAAADGGASANYYLMYFVKTPHTAAILSITWPYECPRCTTGPDSALRNMDPNLSFFLDSFELASDPH